MFFLLYRHTDDGVFDDFPKIPTTFRRLPNTFEEDPEMFWRSYINEFKYNSVKK